MEREYLTCREMVELVTEYIEGTMSLRKRGIFEAHLSICPGCTAYLDQMRDTISVLGKLTEETIPAQARDELLKAFRDWKRG